MISWFRARNRPGRLLHSRDCPPFWRPLLPRQRDISTPPVFQHPVGPHGGEFVFAFFLPNVSSNIHRHFYARALFFAPSRERHRLLLPRRIPLSGGGREVALSWPFLPFQAHGTGLSQIIAREVFRASQKRWAAAGSATFRVSPVPPHHALGSSSLLLKPPWQAIRRSRRRPTSSVRSIRPRRLVSQQIGGFHFPSRGIRRTGHGGALAEYLAKPKIPKIKMLR